MLEQLEPRIVLAADTASVGLALSDGVWSVFAEETAFDDNDTVTSSATVFAGAGGPTAPIAAPLDSIDRFSLGRFDAVFEGDTPLPDPPPDPLPDRFAGYDAETGGQFFAQDGYLNGFFAGLDDDAQNAAAAFTIQRLDRTQLADIQGQWLVQLVRVDTVANRVETLTGQTNIGGQSLVLILTGVAGVGPLVQTIEYGVLGDDGRFSTTNDTSRLYLNSDASVLLGVDLDTTDGSAWIFSAIRANAAPTTQDLAGDYRIGAIATGDEARQALGGRTVNPLHLELTGAGQFRISSLFDDDRGEGPTILSGAFTVSDATITLADTARGVEITLLADANASTLQAAEVRLDGGAEDRLFALAARVTNALPPNGGPGGEGPIVPPEGDILLTEVRVSPTGRPEAFELDEGGQWRRVDLLARATGDTPPTDEAALAVESWTQPGSNETYAAVVYPSATFLYRRNENAEWVARNLTQETSGNPIAGGLTQFLDNDDEVYIAGLDDAGDIVLYQSGAVFPQGPNLVFRFRNLTQQELVPRGQDIPAFTGSLISYVTSWNALTIAGLDTNGDVWGVWTADTLPGWNSSNLSDITGAPPLAGGLTAFLTSWNGINIAGLNAAGEVVVSWWVPAFAGDWRLTNLTDAFNGPTLAASSLTSFVTSWDGLNIAGLDADAELVVYWWAPSLTDWQIAPLTEGLDAAIPRPGAPLSTVVTESNQLNIFGSPQDEDAFARVSWQPGDAAWAIEDVAANSVRG